MLARRLLKPCLVLFLLPFSALALAQGRIVESATHQFEEVAQGVWLATGNGTVYTMSNSMVLVGEHDTLLVDSHVTPAAARALINALPAVTDKPVRYLVNSHYHFDHAHGNQAFPRGVEIIGHEFTRAKLNGEIGNVLEELTFRSFSDPVPDRVAELERSVAAETDTARRAELQETLRVQREYMNAIEEVAPTPPNITLADKLTLFQDVPGGSREIQILHFGRAHTGGDVVVFLPQDGIVFTGDMVGPGLAYMGDGHVDEWPATLEGLKSLAFDTWLPGHGPVLRSRDPINRFQYLLSDLWGKVLAQYEAGVDWREAAERIDLSNHGDYYRQLRSPGYDPRAVRRIYELLEQR